MILFAASDCYSRRGMNHVSRLFVIAVLFLSVTVLAQKVSLNTFAFTHVAVIDVVSGRAMPDMTVIVTGSRISAVGGSDSLHPPAGAQVVNATGKFLIPGLWDMHVHVGFDANSLSLFLPNGVTGMRIMWGNAVHHMWRKSIEDGSLLAPRMVIASNLIDGPNSRRQGSTVARNAEEGRAAVRKAKEDGADFVKVYSLLPRDAYFAIADEAKKLGLPFAGHIPIAVSPIEASNAGQRSVEHLTELIQSTSRRAEEMGKVRIDASAHRPVDPAEARFVWRTYQDTFNPELAAAFVAHFKRNGTWQTPTLTQLRGQEFLDTSLRDDPRLKYLDASTKANWQQTADQAQQRTSQDIDLSKWRWQRYLELVGMMNHAGVPILAGTDVLNPWCLPGFSLHDELALLVQAGLTPAAALQTATINPARFLGREKDLGTISKGKIADLVLLDANPLQDIRNTTRINAVVVNGRLLDRPALDRMLSQVEAAAASSQKAVK